MLSLHEKNLVVLDIETTGTNPFKHDALAVALVPLDTALPSIEIFIRHENLKWNEFARKNFVKFETQWNIEAVSPLQACTDIESYIHSTFEGQEITLVGHNVGFDVAFLRKLAFQGMRDEIVGVSHRAIDTHTILYWLALKGLLPAMATTSSGAFSYFGIAPNESERHTALADAIATRELFLALFHITTGKNGAS